MATDNGCVVSKLQAGLHNGVQRGVRACIAYDYARVFVYVPWSPVCPRNRCRSVSLCRTRFTQRTACNGAYPPFAHAYRVRVGDSRYTSIRAAAGTCTLRGRALDIRAKISLCPPFLLHSLVCSRRSTSPDLLHLERSTVMRTTCPFLLCAFPQIFHPRGTFVSSGMFALTLTWLN